MNNKYIFIIALAVLACACNTNKNDADASGTFEADEVVVSANLPGRILSFNVNEGETIPAGKVVGAIDAEDLNLQKQQVEESIKALHSKTLDVSPQVKLLMDQTAVQHAELNRQLRERTRTENLVKADAATAKQLDDINAQIEVLQRQIQVTEQQINVQKNNVETQNRSILSEGRPLEKKVAQLKNDIDNASIINPVAGTVLTKYAEAGEGTAPGKALYKIADLSTLNLKAYITGAQLSQVKLEQQVKVRVDKGKDEYKEITGTITWISDKAEFTPKTIQTKDERANLVYAVKIKVKNDGYLKIGMYGELLLKDQP